MGTKEQMIALDTVCEKHSNQFGANQVYYSIRRYIYSGRASIEFEKQFQALTPEQLCAMVDKCAALNGSIDETTEAVKKFLRRAFL